MALLGFGASNASALSLGLQWTGNPSQSPTEMYEVGKSGATLFRLPMGPAESAQGNDWTYYDSIVGNAAQNGVTILPHFAAVALPNKAEEGEWVEWIKKAVRRYGYNGVYWTTHPGVPYRPVTAWETWNEPNNPSFGTITPTAYGEFLAWAGKAVQDASESWGGQKTHVLFAGLLSWGNGTNYQTYLKNAYAIGGSVVTGVAFHPYLLDPKTFSEKTRLQAFESSVSKARTSLNELENGAGKSLWITETGWPAEAEYAVGEAEQANLLKASFDWCQAQAGPLNLQAVIWYNYRDFGGPIWQSRSGLRKGNGDYRTAWWTFQSEAGAVPWPGPPATTGPATGIQTQGATLNGTVNPVGHSTSFRFEYGTDTDYGRSVPVPDASAGAGLNAVAASTTVSGLLPGTTYHYRLVATHAGGTTYGADQSFTTSGYRYMSGLSSGSGIASWHTALTMKVGPSDVADFNGDGTADVVRIEPEGGSDYRYKVGFSNANSISSWTQVLSGMSMPERLEFADFNADGKADILALESEGGGKYRYQVGFSNGTGISSWSKVLSGMSLPVALDFADFNADGKADIVAAEAEGGSYSYRVGFSSGSGISSWSKVMGEMSQPTALNAADFNGDGKADIVAVEPQGNGKYRYMLGVSSGGGVSTWGSVLTEMSRPAKTDVADFTGDGKADIVSTELESGSSYRYKLGISSGSGISAWNTIMSPMSYAEEMDLGDFTGDGKADVFTTEVEGGGSYRYKVGSSNGSGISSWETVQSWMREPLRVDLGDVNADGKADIGAVEPEGGGKYRFMFGFSAGGDKISAWNAVMSGMSLPLRFRLADFNGDGKADIVAAEAEGGSYSYRVGFSSGSGISSWSKVLGGMSQPVVMDAGDFNGDGKADIVAAEAEGGSYSYRVGFSSGGGISSWSKVLGGMSQPAAMRVGDFNGDGKADIVAIEAEGGSYSYRVGFSSGGGISSWSKVLSGMGPPVAFDVADFTGDGKADIVAAEAEGGSYSYRVGFSSGGGISSWNKVLGGMSQPSMLAAGDVNADGKADVVAAEAIGGF